ncbi:MAG: hypothetical protein HY349_04285 [Nitrospirae bacterium]|nr:hypothetical protein [Nitrospirota bacterium]
MKRLDGRGASLIELMVSTLVFSMVAASGMKFLVLQNQWAVRQEDTAEAQQSARAALDFMGRELALLGFGLPEGEAKILKAGGQEVEFLANLDAAVARLKYDAAAGQTRLTIEYVNNADKFDKGKTVLVCGADRCERHSLVKDGASAMVELKEGLGAAFPAWSVIQVIKQVRYALEPMDSGPFKLTRTVDGGANPVAEGLLDLNLVYLDREGQVATTLTDIRRIRIQLTARPARAPNKIRILESEVYLRNG